MNICKIDQSNIGSVDFDNLAFGEVFSDHMLSMDYEYEHWLEPQIKPFGKIEVLPSLCSLHYGQVVFEGLKAFYAGGDTINLFRPKTYHERYNRSCQRLCIPGMSLELFVDGIRELVALDRDWVPRRKGCSLYIRPFVFATDSYIGVRVSKSYCFMVLTSPVGAYYKEGMNPVRLMTSGEYVRAVQGGLGMAKTPANYAASLLPTEEAHKRGFTQVLWLDGVERKYIEEVGTMNICFVIDDELVTPALEGSILAGVTRDTVIQVARDWGIKVTERKISIDEVLAMWKEGRLKEVFGTGTAAVISPVGEIQHGDTLIRINDGKTGDLSQRLYDEITGIQYGDRPDKFGWCHKI
ncbi:MAG: branched-chain amino acid aminotransferase [Syntrophobacterales bacterium]|jgi:branched-chain amino acid aminotransferase|nr:branched-chain amino acid aminotransferase [Syntrophobacterales bacterium]